MSNIVKKLHIIWIGSEDKTPWDNIETWQEKHPDWEFRLWGNSELEEYDWPRRVLLQSYLMEGRYPAVADIMRYKILLDEGGFVAPADSVCLHNVEPLLKGHTAIGVYENEKVRPGLISPLYYAKPDHPLVRALIDRLPDTPPLAPRPAILHGKTVRNKAPWMVTGNAHMRRVVESQEWDGLRILPSYRFNPIHHTGERYNGNGRVYGVQQYASTTAAGIGIGKYEWKESHGSRK